MFDVIQEVQGPAGGGLNGADNQTWRLKGWQIYSLFQVTLPAVFTKEKRSTT